MPEEQVDPYSGVYDNLDQYVSSYSQYSPQAVQNYWQQIKPMFENACLGLGTRSFMPPQTMSSPQYWAPRPMLTPAIQQRLQENSNWTNVWGTQYNMWSRLGVPRDRGLEALIGGGGF